MADEPGAAVRQSTMREVVSFFASGDPFLKLEYAQSGVPVLAKGDVKPYGRIEHSEKRYVGEDLIKKRGYRLTEPGDYLLTTRDLTQAANFLGLLSPVPHDQRYLVNQGANVVRFNSRVDGRFVVYWCNGPIYRAYMRGHHVGSTQIHIRKEDFLDAPLWLPELRDQRAIAHFLGTLDDKIELNRRMCETLEAMARALFRSWFVDFDPVRAKAEARDPGLPKPLADLFPARLVDSELGEIPLGWTVKPLGTWADALSGGTPSKTDSRYWNGDIPWISPKVMTAVHADDADAFVTEQAIGNGTRLAPPNSTLVMVRGMGLHEGVRVSQARRAVTFNQDVKALVGDAIDATLLLFAVLCAQPSLLERVESSGHGTGKLPSEVLLAFPISMPDAATQERLAKPLRAMNDRIADARNESRTLAALRDTCLPKLISGEVRVTDPERFVEKVIA